MISKIYKSKAKSLTRLGDRKGKKNKTKAALYRDAARMSRLKPRIARVVNYKDIDYTPEGVFVAVGSTSGIHTSTDGKTWTSSASVTASTWNGVVGMSTATVAVGAAGTIGISTNASWTVGIKTALYYPPDNPGPAPTLTSDEIAARKYYTWNETDKLWK